MRGAGGLQRLAVLAVLAATLPFPASLGRELTTVGVPLDPGLRVPFGAALLGSGTGSLRVEDRVLAFSAVPSRGWHAPRQRSDLLDWLAEYAGSEVEIEVVGGSEPARVRLPVERTSVGRRIGRDAPTFLAGFFLLALALALPRRPAHPAVPPLFAVCCTLGALLLSQLDAVLPGVPALLPFPDARARVGALAFALLPATWIHLAARFPGPAVRLPGTAVLPYLGWGLAAAFAQVHLGDAALRNALDRIALGVGAGALLLVLLGFAGSGRGRRPIERARAWALVGALGTASGLAAASLFGSAAHSRGVAAPLLLAAVAFPSSIAGSILRYGLAAPPSWLTALVSVFRPVARRRFDRERARRANLDAFARSAAEAPDWRGVRRALLAAVGRLLGPEACTAVDLASEPSESSPLARDGLLLWRAAGRPRAPVRVASRCADPCALRAELVVPILPSCGRGLLVILSGRRDGLPWGSEHEALLQSFVPVTATALDAVAKRSELAERVFEKTRTLQRAAEDRGRLLRAVREMGEADEAGRVRAVLERLRAGGAGDAHRALELRPQLQTAAAFAEIALARLQLLEELKNEVGRQAAELTEIRSRRLHAEFVRGVAHELRKPLDELARRVESAHSKAPFDVRLDLAAAGRAGGELARRLDLLLCHSGLRLDRQRLDLLALARAALEGAARAAPDRTFVLETGWRRLPLVGDAGRLASVLENLLDNASRATEPGQKITVRVGLEGAIAARSVFLEVEDPGCGIPAAQRAAVFEPGVSFLPGGFGLGLTLCRQIVRMHGGRLDLSSCPGRTVFRAVVPQIGRAGTLGGASSAVNEEKTGHAA